MLGDGMLVVTIFWSFARLIAPVVTTISFIVSSNKIQNGDILMPAYPGCQGKWPLNERSSASNTLTCRVECR